MFMYMALIVFVATDRKKLRIIFFFNFKHGIGYLVLRISKFGSLWLIVL